MYVIKQKDMDGIGSLYAPERNPRIIKMYMRSRDALVAMNGCYHLDPEVWEVAEIKEIIF